MPRGAEAGASGDKAALLRQVTKQVFVLGVAFVENSTLGSLQSSKDVFDPFIGTSYLNTSAKGRNTARQRKEEQPPCPGSPAALQPWSWTKSHSCIAG